MASHMSTVYCRVSERVSISMYVPKILVSQHDRTWSSRREFFVFVLELTDTKSTH